MNENLRSVPVCPRCKNYFSKTHSCYDLKIKHYTYINYPFLILNFPLLTLNFPFLPLKIPFLKIDKKNHNSIYKKIEQQKKLNWKYFLYQKPYRLIFFLLKNDIKNTPLLQKKMVIIKRKKAKNLANF